MNIIGDVAGNFRTLRALLKKMPDEDFFILGDLIDKGPRSREVVLFVKNHGKSLLGNHEHMLIDNYLCDSDENRRPYYDRDLWIKRNGGVLTLLSFCPDFKLGMKCNEAIPEEIITFLQSFPLYFEKENLFLSHAPKKKSAELKECLDLGAGFYDRIITTKEESSIIWNRERPGPYDNKIQIFGHNPFFAPKFYSNQFLDGTFNQIDNPFAIGIDTSKSRILTGIHYPSLKIFKQDFID